MLNYEISCLKTRLNFTDYLLISIIASSDYFQVKIQINFIYYLYAKFSTDNGILSRYCYSLAKSNTAFERISCHLLFAIKKTFMTLQFCSIRFFQHTRNIYCEPSAIPLFQISSHNSQYMATYQKPKASYRIRSTGRGL